MKAMSTIHLSHHFDDAVILFSRTAHKARVEYILKALLHRLELQKAKESDYDYPNVFFVSFDRIASKILLFVVNFSSDYFLANMKIIASAVKTVL